MDRAGEKLRRVRERLRLTYRDVEEASQNLAERLRNPEYTIALSRLADIENKGTVPTIFRIFTLCAIYRLNYEDVLSWYGVSEKAVRSEWLNIELDVTHEVPGSGNVLMPRDAEFAIDPSRTTFFGYVLRGWGPAPFDMLQGIDLRRYRYGVIGLEDRSMCPILQPGAVIVIDERARILSGGWSDELERPIYLFESREGVICGWCDLTGDRLIVLSHPSSQQKPRVYKYPSEAELIGQVIGVAMTLPSAARPSSRRNNAAGSTAG